MSAPVSNGKFSFSVDSFYVESSGHKLHRRAPLHELTPDPVGHWYEAQLLHYGLPPSKTKAVAKMRLLDAVRGGNLVVPKDIAKGAAAGAGEQKKTPASRKRQNADDADADADADADGDAAQAKGTKKTKAAESKTTPGTTTATAKSTKPAAQSEPKAKAAKPAESKAKKADKASTGSTAAKKTPAKKTDEPSMAPARGTGRGGASSGRRKAESAKDKDEDEEKTGARPPRTKQTARRSRPFTPAFVGRRPMAPPVEEDHYDPMDIDEPESESELKSEDSPSDPDTLAHGSLGLVNGEYEIFSQDLNERGEYPEDEFNLIPSLAGSEMWGAYDFGMFSECENEQRRRWGGW
ncbi:hypothetical protein ASPWEDRAFT_168789 [Aspergillus wentii DTO 134E9]|uniref:Uncharacterized protein n=1 Tax=Aspergillus wentii DTO 134E9 TaxID=1073089 RepID=A0A1L9RVM9_ASPWE|nr:uncharacterized protein ASPWEDRAFT_168789 [Aspergillus wentii DTO 134E9]OJJ38917.1 hypothetical protein ASPWEDRAFT_168789 [Aspergillus wentii DTO 134E9]